MFPHILATAFLLGFLLMLSILNIMRALYDCDIDEPAIDSDPMNSPATVVETPFEAPFIGTRGRSGLE
jgi:hypothetical protein